MTVFNKLINAAISTLEQARDIHNTMTDVEQNLSINVELQSATQLIAEAGKHVHIPAPRWPCGVQPPKPEPWAQPDPRLAAYEQAYQYALTLANSVWLHRYGKNKDWKPEGDLPGLVMQIDNMVAGLIMDDEQDPTKPEEKLWLCHVLKTNNSGYMVGIVAAPNYFEALGIASANFHQAEAASNIGRIVVKEINDTNICRADNAPSDNG